MGLFFLKFRALRVLSLARSQTGKTKFLHRRTKNTKSNGLAPLYFLHFFSAQLLVIFLTSYRCIVGVHFFTKNRIKSKHKHLSKPKINYF